MCGIIGYVGPRPVADVILTGLRHLEYRGYDSAGIVTLNGKQAPLVVRAVREKGVSGIDRIADELGDHGHHQGVGLGHTRWATHGAPSVANAHPHADCPRRIFIVHNGEVTNDRELRERIRADGHVIRSETDTELIAHAIERCADHRSADALEEAVRDAIAVIDGAFAIAVVSTHAPDRIVCARRGSPLLVGIGTGECVVASDEAAIVHTTKRIIDLKDGDVVTITADGIQGSARRIREATWDVAEAQKGGYAHFTRKEIAEQADTIRRALNHGGRLVLENGTAKLGGLERVDDNFVDIDHIRLVGSGTAYHAALIGRQMLLEIAGVPNVEADCASEVRATSFHRNHRSAIIAISQSGETQDTIDAVMEANRKGAWTIGVVNKVATVITRETHCGVYCNAGPEIGVASTKAFVAQLTVLALLTLFFGRQRKLDDAEGRRIAEALLALPDMAQRELDRVGEFAARARTLADRRTFFVIGRKWHYPIALEAALKIEELAYVHAKGYAAGELKHGPLAVLADDAVVLALAPHDETFRDTILAIRQAQKTGATVIGITTADGAAEVAEASGQEPYVIAATLPMLQPILSILPLQLFAYELAVTLGRDVDKPRHLAKSVTVR